MVWSKHQVGWLLTAPAKSHVVHVDFQIREPPSSRSTSQRGYSIGVSGKYRELIDSIFLRQASFGYSAGKRIQETLTATETDVTPVNFVCRLTEASLAYIHSFDIHGYDDSMVYWSKRAAHIEYL